MNRLPVSCVTSALGVTNSDVIESIPRPKKGSGSKGNDNSSGISSYSGGSDDFESDLSEQSDVIDLGTKKC